MPQTNLYASVLAKIGAERGRLIPKDKFKALAASRDLTDYVQQLKETSYQEIVSQLPPLYTSESVEHAVNEALLRSLIKVISSSPKTTQPFLRTLIRKFEVETVKALVKAVYANRSNEEKRWRVYFEVEGFLKHRDAFEKATKTTSLKQLIEVFSKTEYFLALNQALNRFEENGSLVAFDILLDKEYCEKLREAYEKLPKKEQKHVSFYVSTEVDSFALLMLLRGKLMGYDPQWLRVATPKCTFKISGGEIEAMTSASNFESALSIAQKSGYARFFKKAGSPDEVVASAQKTFSKSQVAHASKHRLTDLFNVGAPLSFIVLKRAEAQNVSQVGFGIEAAMKPDEILSKLQFS